MPETDTQSAEAALRELFGEHGDERWWARREEARAHAASAVEAGEASRSQLVYGELDVAALARLLDAAEVRPGDTFLDIGHGHGLPVLAASLLYPRALRICRGVEILPDLWERSRGHAEALEAEVDATSRAPIELLRGDIYQPDPALRAALSDTTLALCFATTWPTDQPHRALPDLSAALHATLPEGARVILVDARLTPDRHPWRWEGELRIEIRDTAPYSTAQLYVRR